MSMCFGFVLCVCVVCGFGFGFGWLCLAMVVPAHPREIWDTERDGGQTQLMFHKRKLVRQKYILTRSDGSIGFLDSPHRFYHIMYVLRYTVDWFGPISNFCSVRF
jgi:hypothetical protein